MKNIDDEIKFYLAESGWYLGDKKIEFFEESLEDMGIDPSIVSFHDMKEHGATDGERIYLKNSLKFKGSLVQILFIALHEYFHIRLGHGFKALNLNKTASHQQEYACDRLALKHLIKTGKYNRHEIRDAISVFKEVIVEGESYTHPSSRDRYNRLMEYVS